MVRCGSRTVTKMTRVIKRLDYVLKNMTTILISKVDVIGGGSIRPLNEALG